MTAAVRFQAKARWWYAPAAHAVLWLAIGAWYVLRWAGIRTHGLIEAAGAAQHWLFDKANYR